MDKDHTKMLAALVGQYGLPAVLRELAFMVNTDTMAKWSLQAEILIAVDSAHNQERWSETQLTR